MRRSGISLYECDTCADASVLQDPSLLVTVNRSPAFGPSSVDSLSKEIDKGKKKNSLSLILKGLVKPEQLTTTALGSRGGFSGGH